MLVTNLLCVYLRCSEICLFLHLNKLAELLWICVRLHSYVIYMGSLEQSRRGGYLRPDKISLIHLSG